METMKTTAKHDLSEAFLGGNLVEHLNREAAEAAKRKKLFETFAKNWAQDVVDNVMRKYEHIPEHWDLRHLRELLADYANDCRFWRSPMKDDREGRRDYRREKKKTSL